MKPPLHNAKCQCRLLRYPYKFPPADLCWQSTRKFSHVTKARCVQRAQYVRLTHRCWCHSETGPFDRSKSVTARRMQTAGRTPSSLTPYRHERCITSIVYHEARRFPSPEQSIRVPKIASKNAPARLPVSAQIQPVPPGSSNHR